MPNRILYGLFVYLLQIISNQRQHIDSLRNELASYVARYGSLREAGDHDHKD